MNRLKCHCWRFPVHALSWGGSLLWKNCSDVVFNSGCNSMAHSRWWLMWWLLDCSSLCSSSNLVMSWKRLTCARWCVVWPWCFFNLWNNTSSHRCTISMAGLWCRYQGIVCYAVSWLVLNKCEIMHPINRRCVTYFRELFLHLWFLTHINELPTFSHGVMFLKFMLSYYWLFR